MLHLSSMKWQWRIIHAIKMTWCSAKWQEIILYSWVMVGIDLEGVLSLQLVCNPKNSFFSSACIHNERSSHRQQAGVKCSKLQISQKHSSSIHNTLLDRYLCPQFIVFDNGNESYFRHEYQTHVLQGIKEKLNISHNIHSTRKCNHWVNTRRYEWYA
jgi:hypothetical protein